jgi:F-type H+-transporting ATPase subunit b
MSLDPLAQIHPLTIGAIIVITLLTLHLLRRVCFLPLLAVMEARAVRIETARRERAEAETAVAQAREAAERGAAAARDEAARIAAALEAEMAALRAERLRRADAEADAILTRGRAEVLQLERSEGERVIRDLHACAAQALAQVVGVVDEPALRLVIQRLVPGKGGG